MSSSLLLRWVNGGGTNGMYFTHRRDWLHFFLLFSLIFSVSVDCVTNTRVEQALILLQPGTKTKLKKKKNSFSSSFFSVSMGNSQLAATQQATGHAAVVGSVLSI